MDEKPSFINQTVYWWPGPYENWYRDKMTDLYNRLTGSNKKTLSPAELKAIRHIDRFKVSLKNTPGVWRAIDIEGTQTLSTLHKAIFKAFDRTEEHEYCFFLSDNPYHRDLEYTSPELDDGTGRLASRMKINRAELHAIKFLYLFDLEHEWWHEVQLIRLYATVSHAKFPTIVTKEGKSPPQYLA